MFSHPGLKMCGLTSHIEIVDHCFCYHAVSVTLPSPPKTEFILGSVEICAVSHMKIYVNGCIRVNLHIGMGSEQGIEGRR